MSYDYRMLHPAPTTKIDPTLARATLLEVHDAVTDATGTTPARVVLSFPNNSYKIALDMRDEPSALRPLIGEMITGRIFATARRIDVPLAGGRRITPCLGTPTRVMGTVVGVDPINKMLVLNAGAPVVLTLSAPGQTPDQFASAEFIACDIAPGASFKLQG